MKPPAGTLIKPGHPHSRGAVAVYPFNAEQGVIAYDYAAIRNWSARNHALIEGATWGGGGLNFNGTINRVNCGSTPSLNNIWDGGGTIIARIKVPSSDGGSSAPRFCSKRNFSNTLGWDILIRDEAGGKKDIQFTMNWTEGVAGCRTTSKEFPIDEMAQFAMTYNSDSPANRPVFFVKGLLVPVTELAAPSGIRTTDAAQDLFIGNRWFLDPGAGIVGKYDDFIVYDRILSASEILDAALDPFSLFRHHRPKRFSFFSTTPPLAVNDPFPPNCTITATNEKIGTINPAEVMSGTIEVVDTMIGEISG